MMPPDEAAALENARTVASIVNTMLAAKDPRRTAASLLTIAALLVRNDVVGQLTLATLAAEMVAELLSGFAPEARADAKRIIASELLH